MIKMKKIMSLLLVFMLLLSLVPINVYAGNNDTKEFAPETKKGWHGWKYTPEKVGIRVSLYWAESEAAFTEGDALKVGVKDFFTNENAPNYRIKYYTKNTVYDYRRLGKNIKENRLDAQKFTYLYASEDETPIVRTMPEVSRTTASEASRAKVEWDKWFEGADSKAPTYDNIPAITAALGYRLTPEDFMSGRYVERGEVLNGYYKLYFEPILSELEIDGSRWIMSLQDMISWQELYDKGKISTKSVTNIDTGSTVNKPHLLNMLPPIFGEVANSQFLIEPELTINMSANKDLKTGKPYQVVLDSTSGTQERNDFRILIGQNGIVRISMGVGVITPEPVYQPKVVSLYYKAVGVDSDGKLILEEAIEPKISIATVDNHTNKYIPQGIQPVEGGIAYLNDIITSSVDMSSESDSIVWKDLSLPESASLKIEPTAKDISYFMQGLITSNSVFIEEFENYIEELKTSSLNNNILVKENSNLFSINKLLATSDAITGAAINSSRNEFFNRYVVNKFDGFSEEDYLKLMEIDRGIKNKNNEKEEVDIIGEGSGTGVRGQDTFSSSDVKSSFDEYVKKYERYLPVTFNPELVSKAIEIAVANINTEITNRNKLGLPGLSYLELEHILEDSMYMGDKAGSFSIAILKLVISTKLVTRTAIEIEDLSQGIYVAKKYDDVVEKELRSDEVDVEIPKSEVSSIDNLDNNKTRYTKNNTFDKYSALENTVNPYNTTYLRYIYVPTSNVVHEIEYVENGSTKGVDYLVESIGSSDSYLLTELSKVASRLNEPGDYSNADLVEWYTSSEFKNTDIDSVTKNASPIGTNLGMITGIPYGDTVYVKWRISTTTGGVRSSDLPEWRLSKVENINSKSSLMSISISPQGSNILEYYLSPSGLYNYELTDISKYGNASHRSGLRSSVSNSNISLSSPRASVTYMPYLLSLKPTSLYNIRTASWLTNNKDLSTYGISNGNIGSKYTGKKLNSVNSEINYRLLNKDTYIYSYSRWVNSGYPAGVAPNTYWVDTSHWGPITSTSYAPSSRNVNYINGGLEEVVTDISRYIPVSTSSRKLTLSGSKVEDNGLTAVSIPRGTLSVTPEVAMLFTDNAGVNSVSFVAGDIPREVPVMSYHTMEYSAFVTPKVTTSTATLDSRARQTATRLGLGGLQPVILKGGVVNSSFDVKRASGVVDKGQLTVKTFVLDIDSSVKNAWGNNSHNPLAIHNDFVSKWTFRGTALSKLEISNAGVKNGSNVGHTLTNPTGNPTYTGPEVRNNNLQYTERVGNVNTPTTHRLVVRGGNVISVNGVALSTVRTSNPKLYAALEGMKLVGANKNATVLSTFEKNVGANLTEQELATLANAAKGVNDLSVGSGWYSEDSTVLLVQEYTKVYELPISVFSDVVPLTVKGLETPVNKGELYNTMFRGHTYLKYTIESSDLGSGIGRVKSYFEHSSRTGGSYGGITVEYGVPNVSIQDGTGW